MNRAVFVLAAMLGAAPAASAHHSFAMYEPTKTLTFKGTVKTFQWTNPHVILWVLVQPDGGEPGDHAARARVQQRGHFLLDEGGRPGHG